ncbi:faciogenital dysplasia protein [Anaeramoeba flamelloides]|uniref:Faciogenital dysplasia protein n=1 Tax=Anaeramoeba flamelloides TaxID=1746091 RepID=A0ABQ8X259_9EUKA|nr:faciogenital dysplasia protein [Anaeramoeba flamelloides]
MNRPLLKTNNRNINKNQNKNAIRNMSKLSGKSTSITQNKSTSRRRCKSSSKNSEKSSDKITSKNTSTSTKTNIIHINKPNNTLRAHSYNPQPVTMHRRRTYSYNPQQKQQNVTSHLNMTNTSSSLSGKGKTIRTLSKPRTKNKLVFKFERMSNGSENNDFRRKKIVEELYQTELTYCDGLRVMSELFYKPLKELNVISEKELKIIFSCLEIINKFNQVLKTKIFERVENWNEKSTIGDLFLQMSDFLKIYTIYLNNFNNSIHLYHELTKKKTFSEAMIKIREENKLSLTLPSYLIMPVQRIPRYVLLLKDLVKNTQSYHLDYPNLVNALDKIKEIADYVNDTKREAENMKSTLEVENKISGLKNYSSADRKYLTEGKLKYFIKKKKIIKVYVIMFTDSMILCSLPKSKKKKNKKNNTNNKENQKSNEKEHPLKAQKSNEKLKLLKIIQINKNTEIFSIEDNFSLNSENSFYLLDEKDRIKHVFIAGNKFKKRKWISEIDNLLQQKIQDLRKRVIAHRRNKAHRGTNNEIELFEKENLRLTPHDLKSRAISQAQILKHKLKDSIEPNTSRYIMIFNENIMLWENEKSIRPLRIIPFDRMKLMINQEVENGFIISTPERDYNILMDNMTQLLAWVSLIREKCSFYLSKILEDYLQKMQERDWSSYVNNNMKRFIKQNPICCDCENSEIKYINFTIGSLICEKCCLVFKEHFPYINKLVLIESDFVNCNKQDINFLLKNGNKAVNRLWENNLLSKTEKPSVDANSETRRKYLNQKYLLLQFSTKLVSINSQIFFESLNIDMEQLEYFFQNKDLFQKLSKKDKKNFQNIFNNSKKYLNEN